MFISLYQHGFRVGEMSAYSFSCENGENRGGRTIMAPCISTNEDICVIEGGPDLLIFQCYMLEIGGCYLRHD